MRTKTNPIVQASLAIGLSVFACGSAWPDERSVTYQITTAHTGAIEFARGLNLPLTQIWVSQFRGQVSYPVVAEGKAFVFVADADVGNNPAPKVAALDLNTGKPVWSMRVPGPSPTFAGLAYDDGKLFVIDGQGMLRALDPSTGARLWARQLGDSKFSAFYTPPNADKGVVYATGRGPSNGTLYAVNATDGHIIWTQQVSGGNYSVPTLSGDGVFVSYDCSLHHFDSVTGDVRWVIDIPIPFCSGGGGTTAVSYAGRLFTSGAIAELRTSELDFDVASGRLIGRVNDVRLYSPVLRGGIGYFSGLRYLTARSYLTGKELWRFTDVVQPALPPIVVNGKVLFASQTGKIFVLDGTSGQKLQTLSVGINIPPTGLGWAGFGAGEDTIVVPVGTKLFAFKGAAP